MKNKWCVYGLCIDRVGKIVEENSTNSVRILYSEGQLYPAELWGMETM